MATLRENREKKAAATAKTKNRAIREDDMRARISQAGLLNNVFDIARDLQNNTGDMENNVVQSKRAAADISMKLLNKVLPDLKQVEQSIEMNVIVPKEINFRITGAKNDKQQKA